MSCTTSKKIPYDRVFVGGFSQGGAMAMISTLGYEKAQIGGAINYGGWFPMQEVPVPVVQKDVPILWGHGTADDLVPFELQASNAKLLREKYGVSKLETMHVDGLDHREHPDLHKAANDFLTQQLAKACH